MEIETIYSIIGVICNLVSVFNISLLIFHTFFRFNGLNVIHTLRRQRPRFDDDDGGDNNGEIKDDSDNHHPRVDNCDEVKEDSAESRAVNVNEPGEKQKWPDLSLPTRQKDQPRPDFFPPPRIEV